jgi:crossover junction endodeoxyribonuclease RuvC
MVVLGVDPGSQVTGYGLLEKKHNRLVCINAGHITPSGKAPFYTRIHTIFKGIAEIIEKHHPDQMAIEDIFYARNVKSSLKLGHARGAVLVAAVQFGLEIFEYTPLEVKKSVVGYGRATKEQVRSMVKVILGLKDIPGLDTSDALAVGICHLNWTRFEEKGGLKSP